jgi:hypothetical protein
LLRCREADKSGTGRFAKRDVRRPGTASVWYLSRIYNSSCIRELEIGFGYHSLQSDEEQEMERHGGDDYETN